MKRRLMIVVPLAVLIALGGVWKLVLAKPASHDAKVDGQVYVLPKEFLVNLTDGRFAKMQVALVLAHDQAVEAEGDHAAPTEGFGSLEQEPVVRDVVVDEVTDSDAEDLTQRRGRAALKRRLLKAIRARTDVKVNDVLLTDVAVQ